VFGRLSRSSSPEVAAETVLTVRVAYRSESTKLQVENDELRADLDDARAEIDRLRDDDDRDRSSGRLIEQRTVRGQLSDDVLAAAVEILENNFGASTNVSHFGDRLAWIHKESRSQVTARLTGKGDDVAVVAEHDIGSRGSLIGSYAITALASVGVAMMLAVRLQFVSPVFYWALLPMLLLSCWLGHAAHQKKTKRHARALRVAVDDIETAIASSNAPLRIADEAKEAALEEASELEAQAQDEDAEVAAS